MTDRGRREAGRALGERSSTRFRVFNIGLVLFILTGVVLLLLEWRERSKTDEDRVRDTVEDFLEACADGDLDEVWDLHSRWVRERAPAWREWAGAMGQEVHEDLDDEEYFVRIAEESRAKAGGRTPEALEDWYPWALPPAVLRGLRIRSIGWKTSPAANQVGVVVRRTDEAKPGERRWHVVFELIREDEGWGVECVRFEITEDLPAPPPPPREESRPVGDGRTRVRIGITPGLAVYPFDETWAGDGLAAKDVVVEFRADRDAPFGSLVPWLRRAIDAGVGEIHIKSERRVASTEGVTAWFAGLEYSVLSTAWAGEDRIRYPVPIGAPEPDVVLEVGPDVRPVIDPALREGAVLRTYVGRVEGRPLHRLADLLGKPVEEIEVLIAPAANVSVMRVADVWSAATNRSESLRRVLLAGPAPPDHVLDGSLVYNGITPEAGGPLERLPPVPPDHPALRRALVRPK